MTRYELRERGLVARRGRLHEFRDLDRHRGHHAIERPPEARLISRGVRLDASGDGRKSYPVVTKPTIASTSPSANSWPSSA